jgi:hypothetical protein
MQHLSFLVALLVANIFFLVLGYLLGFLYHYINGYVIGILSGGLFFAWTILLAYIWHYTYQPTLSKMCPNIWTFAAVLLLGYFIPIRLSLTAYYQIAARNNEVQILTAQNIHQIDEYDKYFFFRAANLRPNINAMQGNSIRLNTRTSYYTYLIPLQDEQHNIVAWLPIGHQTATPYNEKAEKEIQQAVRQQAEKIIANLSTDQFFVNIKNSAGAESLTFEQMQHLAQQTWLPKNGDFPTNTKRFVAPIVSPEAYRSNLNSQIWLWSFALINAILVLVWLVETAINSYRGVYAAV